MLGETQQKHVKLRSIPKKQAEKKILNYVDSHPGAYTSEIFLALKLDPRLVYEVLHELARKDILEAEKIESSKR